MGSDSLTIHINVWPSDWIVTCFIWLHSSLLMCVLTALCDWGLSPVKAVRVLLRACLLSSMITAWVLSWSVPLSGWYREWSHLQLTKTFQEFNWVGGGCACTLCGTLVYPFLEALLCIFACPCLGTYAWIALEEHIISGQVIPELLEKDQCS